MDGTLPRRVALVTGPLPGASGLIRTEPTERAAENLTTDLAETRNCGSS